MKKSFGVVVLFFSVLFCAAQESELAPFNCDSLEFIDRVPYLDKNDSSLKVCLEKSIKNQNKAYQKDSLNMLFDIMWMYSIDFEPQKIIDLKERLLGACTRLPDSIYVYNMMSYSYSQLEDVPNARNEINQGLKIAQRNNDKRLIFALLLESIKHYNALNDSTNVHKELARLEELTPYLDSLNKDRCSFYTEKTNAYLRFGNQEQFDLIPETAQAAIDCYTSKGDFLQAGYPYLTLAIYYLNNVTAQNLTLAENAIQSCLIIAKRTNNIPLQGEAYAYLGTVHLERGNIDLAISILKKSIAIAKEYEDEDVKITGLYSLSESYAKQKNYKKAYESFSEYDIAFRAQSTANNKELFYNLEQQYKTKEKEQEIKLLNQEKSLSLQQRNLFVGLSIFLLGFAALLSFFFYRQNKLNNTITKQYNELQELNKFKDQLFSIIGHDLRNLVYKLNINQRKLLRESKKTEHNPLHPLALTMGTNTENLNGLVENLLFWGMKQSEGIHHHRESLPLKKMAEQVAYNFQSEIEQKGLEIQYDIPDDMQVYSDDNILKMSIRNLLNNAIKFSNPNTPILLEGHNEGNHPVLNIVDQGIGISKEKMPILFELNPQKMSTGTQGEKGTGLGLWLCKELLSKVDARISASSNMGHNTTFTIEFPK